VDKCPNTPEGVFVTRDGCTQEITKVIYFEHASSHINYEDVKEIEQTAELINETPGYNIIISGHTDSIADANINMKLSEKRAIAVKNILLKNKVDKSKIETFWYGETRPVSSNITVEGRRDNRRVTIVLK
ncbi:MAG: OmpA family protein, partial [Arcobacteraceae bacterium]